MLNRDDRLLLHNASDRDVVVLGYEGEPYARLDADGGVWVNTNSKAYYINAERDGKVAVPEGVDSKGEPRWERQSGTGRFEWHDHRMHWMGGDDPPMVKDKDVRTKVFDWTVRVRVGDRPGAIAGTLFWTPTPSSSLPLAAIFAFAGLVIALCIVVFVVRRRREGRPRRPGDPHPARRGRRRGRRRRAPAGVGRRARPARGDDARAGRAAGAGAGAGVAALQRARRGRVRLGPGVRLARPRGAAGPRVPSLRARREVAVRLRGGLADDGYTVTYRVISADSHPVSGGFAFVAGDGVAPATPVADLLGDDRAGPVTGVAFGAARAVQFGAIAAALGALIFLLACWLPGLGAVAGRDEAWASASAAFAGRLRAFVIVAAAAGAVSGALAIVLQGAVAGGTPAWDALSVSVVGDVLATRFGVVWGVGVLAWLVVAALALPGPVPALALGLPLAALAFLPAIGGHAGVQSPVAVLLPANVLHVVAMSAWLGGIAVLVLVLRAATARLDPDDRMRLLAAVVGRFSLLAGIAVAVLLASGVAQGLVEVRTVPNLVETAFGRAVLVKAILFAGIVALGWVNRRRPSPRSPAPTTHGTPAPCCGARCARSC